MKIAPFVLTGFVLVSSQLVVGCATDEDHPTTSTEAVGQSLTTVAIGDYKDPATLDEEISPINETELWGRVYAPAELEEGKRYPLLVFQHGVHGSCGDTSTVPRADSADSYLFYGECYEGHELVYNHAGYGYIAEEMVAQGYIVLSVNTIRGIVKSSGYEGQARGRLILKNLEKLAHWDQGVEPTPAEWGFDLQGHVDFSQVGLMGHSRGGISTAWAYKLSLEDTINWNERLGTQLSFRSIFNIAPVDFAETADPVGIPLAVLLPLCDGSVFTLPGVNVFDRSMSVDSGTSGAFRATVAVAGTNHNYYNTEWQYSDASSQESDGHCVGQVPLFETDSRDYYGWYKEGVIGSESQREVGKQLVSRFFLGTVGVDRDPAMAAIFDPSNPLPAAITGITPVDRGFSPSAHPDDRLEFEDFQGETGVGPLGEPAWINGIDVEYIALDEHDSEYRGAHVTWESASNTSVFEPRLTAAGEGVNLEGFDTLDFRVDPANDPAHNVASTLNFSVQLVDGNGTVSQPVNVSDYVTLSGRKRIHSVLQTVRIPLSDFGGSLTNVRGVRFTFGDTTTGSIYLASIRATKGGIAAPPVVSSLGATVEINSEWSAGYCAEVTVTNEGDERITGWSVRIDPNDSQVDYGWSAELNESEGSTIASSLPWNETLEPGASTAFGFCGTKLGTLWQPQVEGL